MGTKTIAKTREIIGPREILPTMPVKSIVLGWKSAPGSSTGCWCGAVSVMDFRCLDHRPNAMSGRYVCMPARIA